MLDALTTPVNERERPVAANESQICISPHRFMTPNTPNRPRTSPPPAPNDPCHGRPTTAKTTARSLTTTAHHDATSQQRTAQADQIHGIPLGPFQVPPGGHGRP